MEQQQVLLFLMLGNSEVVGEIVEGMPVAMLSTNSDIRGAHWTDHTTPTAIAVQGPVSKSPQIVNEESTYLPYPMTGTLE